MKMSSNKSQEQKNLSSRTMQYTSSQYDELFKSVINSKGSPVLRKSPRISLISSPSHGSSPQDTAEEPQECASLENSQTTRSQYSPKAITKISEINSEASKKLSDYSENNQPDSVSTLQSEEFRNNAMFSTPVEKKLKTKIVSKNLKKSSSPKSTKKEHKSFRNALNALNTSILNGTLSQASSSFSLQDMVPLSQPPKNLRHQQKMLWLRERRGTGLYVACDSCDKWRFLETPDPLDLPKQWFCKMNPDPKFNRCTIPEETIPIFVDDDLIHNVYTAGSLVWARYLTYPWWPAIVEDDPDTEQYYWLEYMSDIPTHYQVMFFDAPNQPVTRAWVTPNRVKPFMQNITMKNLKSAIKYGNRIRHAKQFAQDASKLNIKERLRKYGFLAYSNIEIHSPIETPEPSDNEGDGPSTHKPIRKSIILDKNNPKRRSTIVSEDNNYVNNEIKKSFEIKKTESRKKLNVQENMEKVSKSWKISGTKNRRFTVAEKNFDKKEQCVINTENSKSINIQVGAAKVFKSRKSVIKTLDTISEMNFEDDETDIEYEGFETQAKIRNVSKARKSMSKSAKTYKNRRNTLSEDLFENTPNKKFRGQLVTNEKIKNRRNTFVDQASSSDTIKRSQLASEKTPTKKQKNSISSVGKNEKSYSKIKRRNTFANDSENMNDAFNLSEQNIFPDRSKTNLNSTCLNKSLENVGLNKNTSKNLKRKNSSSENDRFPKTYITAENYNSNNIISFNKSNSNFENKIKLVYKEIFDEDSNDAFQMTDKKKQLLAVIETNGNKSKKKTPAKKPLTNKGIIWPSRKVDNSSNSLSRVITNFNTGKDVKVTDNMTSFDFSSDSQNETKVKKRLGYNRKK